MKFEYSYLSRFPPSKWEVRFTIPGLCADVRTSSHRVRSAEVCDNPAWQESGTGACSRNQQMGTLLASKGDAIVKFISFPDFTGRQFQV